MSKFEGHTPGPWKAGQAGFADKILDAADRPGVVAEVWYFDRTPEERRANAALIAAAPDLLAENKRLRAALQEITEYAEREEMPEYADEVGLDYVECLEMSYENIIHTAYHVLYWKRDGELSSVASHGVAE